MDEHIVIQSKKGPIEMPVMRPKIVPIDMVQANDYNPNRVPKNNMQLLEESILSNGFCFAVVTIWDEDLQKYVIVDGFHRYTVFKDYLEAEEIAIIVLNEDINQRRAATVQFNRARGVHQVEDMGDLVAAMLKDGMDETEIAKALGMDFDEVLRLKQVTGIAELFKNQTYSKSWEMEEINDGLEL